MSTCGKCGGLIDYREIPDEQGSVVGEKYCRNCGWMRTIDAPNLPRRPIDVQNRASHRIVNIKTPIYYHGQSVTSEPGAGVSTMEAEIVIGYEGRISSADTRHWTVHDMSLPELPLLPQQRLDAQIAIVECLFGALRREGIDPSDVRGLKARFPRVFRLKDFEEL